MKKKLEEWFKNYSNINDPIITLILNYQKLSEEFLVRYIDLLIELEGKGHSISYNLKNSLVNNTYFLPCEITYNKKIPEDVKQRIINLKKVIDQ